MGLGEKARDLAGKAGEVADAAQEKAAGALDRTTDAAATGVEKVADLLDDMTGGLFEERIGETGGKVAETLRNVGDKAEDDS